MGLFRDIGRNYEEFKQEVRETADESAEFRCTACDAAVHTDTDTCPECGADAVDER
ncbi:hypothetical protein [Halocalculus aciditolerans]|uniref:Small CPxCG-related zinc finger protein n=1 Tax=Halocalculus aciditolerans TaxID=1383812 RepID=A0A830FN87_9EURY|nr:hypothetical protein [Halocalculus aciditolerans]GGL63709.1 hypothetical protein GCM10009039_22030 [Halocalculus aciditolerans]